MSKPLRSPGSKPKMPVVRVGDKVSAMGKVGIVRYVGETKFMSGNWVGMELPVAEGKNDGSVQGVRYFKCKDKYGMFVRIAMVKTLDSTSGTKEQPTPVAAVKVDVSRQSQELKAKAAMFSPKSIESTLGSPIGDEAEPLEALSPGKEPETEVSSPGLEDGDAVKDFAPSLTLGKEEAPVPFQDYKKLLIKTQHLETLRSEDRAKWAELEKDRNEVGQFKVLRKRMTDKLRESIMEVKHLRMECEDLKTNNAELKEKVHELGYRTEELVMDLESKDEENRRLEQRLVKLKDMIDENQLAVESEALGGDQMQHLTEKGYDAKVAKELIEKQMLIDRLKDTLTRLRDAKYDMEFQLRQQLQQAEDEVVLHRASKEDHLTAKQELAKAKAQVSDLQARLEDFNASDEMIETLTQQNLDLHDKIKAFEAQVEDLEAHKEVSDELESYYNANERDYLDRIDRLEMHILEVERVIDELGEERADHINTIDQYRQYTETLKDDITELQQRYQLKEDESLTLKSKSQKMLSMNSSLQSMVFKAQAKAIDLELRKMEAGQATMHLKCVEPYLPEAFFKKESDAIRTFLQFQRLDFKCELIGTHLTSSMPVKSLGSLIGGTTDEMMIITEATVSNYDVRTKLLGVAKVFNAFVQYLSTCEVQAFLGMSKISADLNSAEQTLDLLLNHLRQDTFSAHQLLPDIERLLAMSNDLSLAQLDPIHSANPHVSVSFSLSQLKSIVIDSDVINLKLTLLYRALTSPADLDLLFQIANDDKKLIVTDLLRPLTELLKSYQQIKPLAFKIQNIVIDQFQNSLAIGSGLVGKIQYGINMHEKLLSFSAELVTKIFDYLKLLGGQEDDVTLEGLQAIVAEVSSEKLEQTDIKPFDGAYRSVTDVTNHLTQLLELVTEPSHFDPLPVTVTPWHARSQQFQTETTTNQAMDRKLQSLNLDIQNLISDIRAKEQLLAEKNLKIEHLEVKLDRTRKEFEESKIGEEDRKKFEEQEKMYLDGLDKLQNEVQALEVENLELRQQVLQLGNHTNLNNSGERVKELDQSDSKNQTNINSADSRPNYSLLPNGSDPIAELTNHITLLTSENIKIKAEQYHSELNSLPTTPSFIANPKTSQAVSQAKSLYDDLSTILASPKVLDIRNRKKRLNNTNSLLAQYADKVNGFEKMLVNGLAI